MKESKIEFFKRRLYSDFKYWNMQITRELLLNLLAVNAQYNTETSRHLTEAIRRIWRDQFDSDTMDILHHI